MATDSKELVRAIENPKKHLKLSPSYEISLSHFSCKTPRIYQEIALELKKKGPRGALKSSNTLLSAPTFVRSSCRKCDPYQSPPVRVASTVLGCSSPRSTCTPGLPDFGGRERSGRRNSFNSSTPKLACINFDYRTAATHSGVFYLPHFEPHRRAFYSMAEGSRW